MEIYKYQYVTENAFAEKAILLAFYRGGNVKDGLWMAKNRYRGKGVSEQKVTVHHVHVADGGQAILGSVER